MPVPSRPDVALGDAAACAAACQTMSRLVQVSERKSLSEVLPGLRPQFRHAAENEAACAEDCTLNTPAPIAKCVAQASGLLAVKHCLSGSPEGAPKAP